MHAPAHNMLTAELAYDPAKSLGQQAPEVVAFLNALLASPAPEVMEEPISATLTRPIREQWDAADCEVIRVSVYNHPPTHPACFATRNVTVLVRSKIIA